MTQVLNALQAALANANLVNHEELPGPFASDFVASRIGFLLSAEYGKAATRIQRLANPPKGSNPTQNGDTVLELLQCIRRLAWGLDKIGENMRPVEEAIAEWAGGGFSAPARPEEIGAVAQVLGISEEAAKMTADSNRVRRTDYLAIRRRGLAPIMEGKITDMLRYVTDDQLEEPTTEEIEKACNSAFNAAVMWGNWAEAALIKADMVYHCGKSPVLDMADVDAQHKKAETIRDELARRQAQQAEKDAETLRDFDVNTVMAA